MHIITILHKNKAPGRHRGGRQAVQQPYPAYFIAQRRKFWYTLRRTVKRELMAGSRSSAWHLGLRYVTSFSQSERPGFWLVSTVSVSRI